MLARYEMTILSAKYVVPLSATLFDGVDKVYIRLQLINALMVHQSILLVFLVFPGQSSDLEDDVDGFESKRPR